jgi:hypothetical protein
VAVQNVILSFERWACPDIATAKTPLATVIQITNLNNCNKLIYPNVHGGLSSTAQAMSLHKVAERTCDGCKNTRSAIFFIV